MQNLVSYFLTCLFLYFLYILFKFINKVWLAPIQTQSVMRSQGIQGPSYKFLHGNTKEISKMREETRNYPIELTHEMLTRIQPHIYSWIKLYGMNFLFWYGTRPQLVITEPELVKEIMNSKEEVFSKVEYYEYVQRLLGDGLVLSRGEKWLKMRKLANHAFHAEGLRGMVPAIISSVEMMLKGWRYNGGKEIDVFKEFKVLTSEVISRTAFGSSYQEGGRIFDMLMKMISIVGRNHFKVGIPGIREIFRTRDDIEFEKIQQGVREAIIGIIKKREIQETKDEPDCSESDFLGLLLKAYVDPDQTKKISIDDLIDECKNFYIAGQETTASGLTWTVLLMAIFKDWQDKAREEVLQQFGHQNPTADGIGKLKIMSMIINESLRLYPPVFNITREAQKEVRLGNLVVPAKMEVYISNLALHYDPQIWGDDVHLFKPERFAQGLVNATNNNNSAFLPFGLGPRICVGLNFAMTEMKIVLAMILQHYRFTLSPNYIHLPVQILTMCPQHGVQVMVEAL
ncbi:hypothetical protein K2173_017071 [Erythroxylum novogranatense]|uniref:Cytochrome P450 n=1 Tax=Erythroxylum novogranatense TaxID=1862640 RepID=A0AAV8U5R3_9ROSI|nr:hypothetical protein K2173_017071 [Erythroxylum novogranatense]